MNHNLPASLKFKFTLFFASVLTIERVILTIISIGTANYIFSL